MVLKRLKLVSCILFFLIASMWSGNRAGAGDPVALTVLLPWDNQFQFSGLYVAEWQGFFAEENLHVVLQSPFNADGSIKHGVEEVTAGRVDIGIGAGDILLARDQGKPVAILLSIFQRSPVAVFSRAESGINAPSDLINSRVWRRKGYLPDAELLAMLRHEGINESALQDPYIAAPGQRPFSLLAAGEIDAYAGYGLTAFWRAKVEGIQISAILPASYGVDFYGDSLYAMEEFVLRNPDAIDRFKRAVRKGWSYAMANPEAVARRITQDMPRKFPIEDLEGFNIFQADLVRRLMMYPLIEIGHVNAERWRSMHRILAEGGLVSQPFDPAVIYDPEAELAARKWRLYRFVYIAGAAAVGILMIGGFWVFLLRRTVRRRTASLEQEVLQRLQAEQKLKDTLVRVQSLIDAMPQFIYRIGTDQKIEFINDAYLKASGLHAEDLIGKTAMELSPAALAEKYTRDNQAVFDTGEAISGIQEHFFPHANGKSYVEFIKIPIRDGSGEVVGLQGIFWDVTERFKQQEELKAALIRAEEANASKSQFLANMSHELRTPLNSILGFSEIIEEETFGPVGTPKYKEYAGDIHYSASHLLSLINDILDISKVESGALTIEEEDLDLGETLDECLRLLETKITQKGLVVETQVAPQAQWVHADPRIVRQVLLNLLTNAVKYTQNGGLILISTLLAEDDGVTIRVKDTGVGISEEDLETLFQPFVQAHNNPMVSHEGTGLGLALSRRLAATHDATVNLESTLGEGTTAIFHLPGERRLSGK